MQQLNREIEIDNLLKSNEVYSQNFKHGALSSPPKRKLAILSCMDARLNVENALGLNPGDAHIIRNAGGIATDDAIRSFIISHELLGTSEFLIINHLDCGMLKFEDQDLRDKLQKKHNSDASQLNFHTFKDIQVNVKNQVEKIKSSPFLSKDIVVHGLIYDVKTGKLQKII